MSESSERFADLRRAVAAVGTGPLSTGRRGSRTVFPAVCAPARPASFLAHPGQAPAGRYGGGVAVSTNAFDPIFASLHEAALDDACWPAATVLSEEACGAACNTLTVGESVDADVRVSFNRPLYRGEDREDLAREYFALPLPRRRGAATPRASPRGRTRPRPGPLHGTGTAGVGRVQRGLVRPPPGPQRRDDA